jgi:hypothetical protein
MKRGLRTEIILASKPLHPNKKDTESHHTYKHHTHTQTQSQGNTHTDKRFYSSPHLPSAEFYSRGVSVWLRGSLRARVLRHSCRCNRAGCCGCRISHLRSELRNAGIQLSHLQRPTRDQHICSCACSLIPICTKSWFSGARS